MARKKKQAPIKGFFLTASMPKDHLKSGLEAAAKKHAAESAKFKKAAKYLYESFVEHVPEEFCALLVDAEPSPELIWWIIKVAQNAAPPEKFSELGTLSYAAKYGDAKKLVIAEFHKCKAEAKVKSKSQFAKSLINNGSIKDANGKEVTLHTIEKVWLAGMSLKTTQKK